MLLVFALLLSGVVALPRILIYSRTLGYRHDSIPIAIEALKTQGPTKNVTFDATEDNTQFNSQNLANYDAVLFLSTTDSDDTPRVEILNEEEKSAFHQYLLLGGNYIGIHSSSDSLTNTPWFGNETGAFFDYHPALQNATVLVLNSSNPSTSKLPTRWLVQDEVYNFKSDPRTVGAFVLLSVDESSYVDSRKGTSKQGEPHPIAWGQEQGAGALSDGSSPPITGSIGRTWYTSLGHQNETWQDELFLEHIMGGIQWALSSGTTRAFNSKGSVGNTNSSTPAGSGGATSTSKPTGGTSSTLTPTSSSSSNGAHRLSLPWKLEL